MGFLFGLAETVGGVGCSLDAGKLFVVGFVLLVVFTFVLFMLLGGNEVVGSGGLCTGLEARKGSRSRTLAPPRGAAWI